MHSWWTQVVGAADFVAGRGGLWLPGALAWCLTVGWIPLVAAVARPPTVADLTFLGARLYTSGAWPWNAVVASVGAVLIGVSAFVLVAVAEAILVRLGRRIPSAGEVARVAAIGFVTAAPAIALLLAAATAFVIVSLREFTAPGVGDPLVRSLIRVSPFLVAVAAAWLLGGVAHAAAVREALLRRAGFTDSVLAVRRRLHGRGVATAGTALMSALAGVAYLGVATLLLAVLWDPIEARLAVGGIDAAVVPLLVGFVAIWLCLVLGGGALHAWASVTWTRVLGGRPGIDGAAARHTQGDPQRP